MKVLIASDLHGDADAVRLLLTRFAAEGAERIFLCGDLLSGRMPSEAEECARLLNLMAARITAVRGNCDSAFDERLLAFALPPFVLTEIGARRVLLSHGHLYGEHRLPTGELPDLIATGHTHVSLLAKRAGYVALNPGSLSRPRGASAAGYAVATETRITLKSADGAVLESLDW